MCSVVGSNSQLANIEASQLSNIKASNNVDYLYEKFIEKINAKVARIDAHFDEKKFGKIVNRMNQSAGKIRFDTDFNKDLCLNANLSLLTASKLMLENFKLNPGIASKYRKNIRNIILRFSAENTLNDKQKQTFKSTLEENKIDLNDYKITSAAKPKKIKRLIPAKKVDHQMVNAKSTQVGGSALARWLAA